MTTIPTSYTIRALNRWLASLKLESDSPTIRALHAAVDELDDAPNDLIADAEALLLAATSITVLAFDALEHAAGEIGLEVDEEERAEVKESATLMRGIADLLGEIRERRAEDAMVEEVDAGEDMPRFWLPTEMPDLSRVDGWIRQPPIDHDFWVAEMPNPGTMTQFMERRVLIQASGSEVAAVRFLDTIKSDPASIWVQPKGSHGQIVAVMGYHFPRMPRLVEYLRYVKIARAAATRLYDVEIVDEVAHGMAPGSVRSVQDFLVSHGLGDVGVEQPGAPNEDAALSSTPTTQA